MRAGRDKPRGLGGYPGSDTELIAALRLALETRRWRPEDLDRRAGLVPGATRLMMAGRLEPSWPALRKICRALVVPRWLFHLTGTVMVGADLGYGELKDVVRRRYQMLKGNAESVSGADLVIESVEILLAISEDLEATEHVGGSRRAITNGLGRLARRASCGGEPGISRLISVVATLISLGREDEGLSQLDETVVESSFDSTEVRLREDGSTETPRWQRDGSHGLRNS